MFLDTSAILVILFNENDKEQIASLIGEARQVFISPIVYWECVVSCMNRKGMTL